MIDIQIFIEYICKVRCKKKFQVRAKKTPHDIFLGKNNKSPNLYMKAVVGFNSYLYII